MMTYEHLAAETRMDRAIVIRALDKLWPTVINGLRYYRRDLALSAIADYIERNGKKRRK